MVDDQAVDLAPETLRLQAQCERNFTLCGACIPILREPVFQETRALLFEVPHDPVAAHRVLDEGLPAHARKLAVRWRGGLGLMVPHQIQRLRENCALAQESIGRHRRDPFIEPRWQVQMS